jgi:hypothetical protein
MKTHNQYKYCYKLCDEIKEKYGNNLLQTELNIGYENPFVIATILIDGKIIITKFLQFFALHDYISIMILYLCRLLTS